MRENVPLKRVQTSLQVTAFKYILVLSSVLILVIGLVTLVNNFFSTMRSYKRETANTMEYAVSLIGAQYLEKAYEWTRQVYVGLPEELAADPFTEEYQGKFLGLIDDEFWNAYDTLELCREKNKLSSIALIFPDVPNERAVYVVDGYKLEEAYIPGQYLSKETDDIDTPEQMEKVASSVLLLHVGHGEVNGWIATNYIKVYDSKGNWLGYCTCDVDINDFFDSMIRSVVLYILVFVIVVVVMAARASRFMKRTIINPINTLAMAAVNYTARDKTQDIELESYFDGLNIDTKDEIETLYHSLTDMEADINTTMKRIREMTAEKEREAAELDLAARIQANMLPTEFPLFPEHSEFDLYATMDPAKEVGGDFYDAFLIDESHLGMVIADVSGKGVPAALFMMVSRTILKNRACMGGTPAEIIQDVNRSLCQGNTEMMFVTVWLGILDLNTGEVIECNAGHEDPVIKRKGGDYEIIQREHGFVLGAMAKMQYECDSFTLGEGDILFVYTDGLPEATNGEGNRLEIPRMLEALNKHKDDDIVTLLGDVRAEVDAFVKDAEQFDDLTMMAVEYKGADRKKEAIS